MTDLVTEAWRRAAGALAVSDAAALDAVLPRLPAAAAKVLAETVRRPAHPLPAPAGVPEGVDCLADSRFLAFLARKRAVVRWDRSGRELVSGCYLMPGDVAELALEPGDVRLVVLRESGADA